MTGEIKKCPFCGGELLVAFDCNDETFSLTIENYKRLLKDVLETKNRTIYGLCDTCNIITTDFDKLERLIDFWNNRRE